LEGKKMKNVSIGAVIGSILTYTLLSCTTVPPPTPQEVKKSYPALEGWKPEWSPIVVDALETYGKELLAFNPRDRLEWCFGEDNKLNYLRLIQAIAKFESNFDPSTTYRETFHDRQGRNVISTGIMQVSAESCNGYGMSKKLTRYEELLDVHANMECTVRIMNKWIREHGVIAQEPKRGTAIYWSVMRESGKRKFVKQIMCNK
jgi:hypothetical protein